MSKPKKESIRVLGLTIKLTLSIVVLVTIIALALGAQVFGLRNRRDPAEELEKRSRLLIESIAAQAETEMRKGTMNRGNIGIQSLLESINRVEEARFVTIAGPADALRFPCEPSRDFVWASNASSWKAKEASGTFQVAAEQENDALSVLIVPALQRRVNDAALHSLAAELADWRGMHERLLRLEVLHARSAQQQTEYSNLLHELPAKLSFIDSALLKLPENAVHTEPKFDPNGSLAPRYLFYKPLVFFAPEDGSFYQGLVRLEVDTKTVSRMIRAWKLRLARSIALSIILGIIGSYLIARITSAPIRRLARGAAVIRATEDKETLKGHLIEVGTRDEIGWLADAVNEMTQGLVKAAAMNKELLQGIDVQKGFLPLRQDARGGKASTAEEQHARLEIYGYYKGARGLSGDYFDFRKLDDTHYVLIECDVSGKGAAAALVMVEVATLFISYFRNWSSRKKRASQIKDRQARQRAMSELERLEPFVRLVNTMLEERGFTARFATLTVCLYNSATGALTVCNAGNTKLHIFRAEKKSMVHLPLPATPAAGAYSSAPLETRTPFSQVVHTLEPGDALFLCTGGLETARRTLRSAQREKTTPGVPRAKDGETTESFGRENMDNIINAVFSRRRYRLIRSHDLLANEGLDFDFSHCEGTAKEAVLALVSAERVFRMIPCPRREEESVVTFEREVDDFMMQHFIKYPEYFAHRLENNLEPGLVTLAYALEDEPSDDLALLVIRRKPIIAPTKKTHPIRLDH